MNFPQPWAEFAERVAKELFNHGATEGVAVTRNEEEDRVVVNYLNCDFEKRCILIGHLLADLILEVIDINAEEVKEILEGDNDADS